MNRRQHATLARMLIRACGGLEEAAGQCRIGKSQLGDCQSPQGEAYMPADVIADLETYCGQPHYSRAMAEALPEAAEAACLTDEAMEATESVATLMGRVRRAAADGTLTPRERAELMPVYEEARAQLGDVGAILAREG